MKVAIYKKFISKTKIYIKSWRIVELPIVKKIRDEMNVHEDINDIKNYIVNAKDEKKEINVIIKDTLDLIKKGKKYLIELRKARKRDRDEFNERKKAYKNSTDMQKEMKNSQPEKDKKRLKELEVLISDEKKNKKENEERLENKEFNLEKYEYNDILDQSIANEFNKLKISYNTKIKPKTFNKYYHKFADKFYDDKHWDREVYKSLKNVNNSSEDALYKYNLERKEIENRMPKNKNVINKLKRGLNMVEPDMDELKIRDLIQKKKNKDIKIRAKIKNEKNI